MNLTKALSVQTAAQKQQLLSRLPDSPEYKSIVNDAFAEAVTIWKDRLASMIGKEEAEEVFGALEKEIRSDSPSLEM